MPRAGAGGLSPPEATGDEDSFCSEWNYGNGYDQLQARELQWKHQKDSLPKVGSEQMPQRGEDCVQAEGLEGDCRQTSPRPKIRVVVRGKWQTGYEPLVPLLG